MQPLNSLGLASLFQIVENGEIIMVVSYLWVVLLINSSNCLNCPGMGIIPRLEGRQIGWARVSQPVNSRTGTRPGGSGCCGHPIVTLRLLRYHSGLIQHFQTFILPGLPRVD